MNTSEFDKLTRKLVSPLLEGEYDFLFSDGTYYKELPNKVRQVVTFDLDMKKGSTFRVMLGVNSSIITGSASPTEAGVFGLKYLSENGLAFMPSNFPCFNEDLATKSLTKIVKILTSGPLAWLLAVDTIEKAANLAEEQYPFIKGKLYLVAGQTNKAKQYFAQHLAYLVKLPESSQVVEAIRETQKLLQLCV